MVSENMRNCSWVGCCMLFAVVIYVRLWLYFILASLDVKTKVE
jgi:hypothetical protein